MYSKSIVLGRCGSDPEMKYSAQGMAIATVSVAEDRGWGDKKETVWWRISCFGKAAESMNEHVHKGDVVIVEGRVKAHAWIAQDGSARGQLEMAADGWRFGGGKRAEGDGAQGEADESEAMPF